MGHKQLLTLVLVAIIICFAMVRGMDGIRETPLSQHAEDVRAMLLQAAVRAQMYYRKPIQMAGGGRSFAAVSWAKLNFNPNTPIATLNMMHKHRKSVCLTAASLSDPAVFIGYRVYADSIVVMH